MRRRRSVVTSRPRSPRSTSAAGGLSVARARPVGRPSIATRPARGEPPAAALEPAAAVDLSVDLAPGRPGRVHLAHPFLVAAGGCGYGLELMAAAASGAIEPPAAIVTRGTTLRPHGGSPPPRMAATRSGLVSAIGPQNPGLARVLELHAERWSGWDIPVLLGLCAEDDRGFAALARGADAQPGVAGLEVHVGCADLQRPGRTERPRAAWDPEAAARVIAAVRAETSLPVVAKLGAVAPAVGEMATAVVDAGADAISAIDALPALAIDRGGPRWALGAGVGTLSGPALTPVALRVVAEVARAVRVPIVGIGGVATLDDALDLLMAGASAVGLATAALGDPGLPGRLARELGTWCRAQGVASVSDIVGSASPARGGRRRG